MVTGKTANYRKGSCFTLSPINVTWRETSLASPNLLLSFNISLGEGYALTF